MKELMAKNPKQLDICLRLLYAEHVNFFVNIHETNNGKIVYGVSVNVDDETKSKLEEKYRIMIS